MGVVLNDSPLIYNGINLFIVKTNMFSQRAIYTPDNVDYLYTEFTLDVNCLFNPSATSYLGTNPPTFDPGIVPSYTNATIRHFLLQPRAPLEFIGLSRLADVIASPQPGYPTDVNNGPMPISCDVFRLDGDKTFHVHYVIKTWLIECPVPISNPIISNRWSQSAYINTSRYLVRKTVGQAFFRTDILNVELFFADYFRSAIINAIPPKPGLFRDDVKFVVNSQGNAIHYEITDIERPYNLGDTIQNQTYITKVDGYFSQGTMSDDPKSGPANGCSLIEMKVQLWGTFEANNWTLCQMAIIIINAQIPLEDIGPVGRVMIRGVNLTQSLSDNYVEVTMSVQTYLNDPQIPKGVPFNTKYLRLVKPVSRALDPGDTGDNPGLQNDVGSRGSEAMILLSAALTEACSPQGFPVPNQTTSITGEQPPYGNPPNVQIYENDILPTIQPKYNPNQQPPYNRSTTESQYQYNSGSIQAPVANPNNPSANGQGSSESEIVGPYRCEILNFCAPYSTLHVDWWMERIGIPPDIPHFIKNITCLAKDQQAQIQTAIVHPYSFTLANDLETWIFSVSGSYDYIIPFSQDPQTPPLIVFDSPQNLNGYYGGAFIAGNNSSNCASGQLSSNYIHGIIDSEQGNQQQGGQGEG